MQFALNSPRGSVELGFQLLIERKNFCHFCNSISILIKRTLFNYKDYRKTCKCNTENGRCHWRLNMEDHEDESDIVPSKISAMSVCNFYTLSSVCEFSKTNRIINGQDAIANSKRYMVSVQTRPKTRFYKFKISRSLPNLNLKNLIFLEKNFF